MLKWQALPGRCLLFARSLLWLKLDEGVSCHRVLVTSAVQQQLIPAWLARLAGRISADEQDGEWRRWWEQWAMCREISADTSRGGSGLIPAQVTKPVKATDTCRNASWANWLNNVGSELVSWGRGLIYPSKMTILIRRTSVHLDSFIRKTTLLYVFIVNYIFELNKPVKYLLFSSHVLILEGKCTKSFRLFKSVLLAP